MHRWRRSAAPLSQRIPASAVRPSTHTSARATVHENDKHPAETAAYDSKPRRCMPETEKKSLLSHRTCHASAATAAADRLCASLPAAQAIKVEGDARKPFERGYRQRGSGNTVDGAA